MDSNYYSFSKRGYTIEERLAADVREEDMALVKENSNYQNDFFTIFSLSASYLSMLPFSRVSKNKYCLTNNDSIYQFVSICCPNLINDGFYMTFSKVTIETEVDDMHARIRLYASPTQIGKLVDTHKDEIDKPNWYLLFSEARINII